MFRKSNIPDSFDVALITLATGVIQKVISEEQAISVMLTVDRLADLYSGGDIDQGFMEDMVKAKMAIEQAVQLDALKRRG